MPDRQFASDLREISAILSRTALGTPRRVFAATIAIVVVMGVLTGVAARAYHDARQRGARAQFEQGESAVNAGHPEAALEHFRAALALERDNGVYRRALAIALLGLRRPGEAQTHLEQILEEDPVDGEANLLLARIAAGRGAFTETEAFYQRAIYGRWPNEAPARRLGARFELIEWLVQINAVAQARAEQLRLQAELPDVPFLQLELARRMLALGQPAPAAAILRRELDRSPSNASIAADLTKAEMDMGRFVEARAAARRALALDARDRQTRERLTQITEVLALDPTQRGLTDTERFRRAERLLARTRDELLACLTGAASSGTQTAGAPPPATAAQSGSAAPTSTAQMANAARAAAEAQTAGTAQPAAGTQPGQRPAQAMPAPLDVAAALANAEALLKDPRSLGSSSAEATASPAAPSTAQNQAATSPSATASSSQADAMHARIDARLAAAEALWNARVARCGAASGALAWIFDHVAT